MLRDVGLALPLSHPARRKPCKPTVVAVDPCAAPALRAILHQAFVSIWLTTAAEMHYGDRVECALNREHLRLGSSEREGEDQRSSAWKKRAA